MSLLSNWDEIDAGVELLTDDVWSAEDDKTGFLSVEVNSFDRLYLKNNQFTFPWYKLVLKKKKRKTRISEKAQQIEIWDFWWTIKIFCLVIQYPPYGKD